MATRTVSVPYASLAGVGQLDQRHFHIAVDEDEKAGYQSGRRKGHSSCIVATIIIVLGTLLLGYLGYALSQMMQSEVVGSFTHTLQAMEQSRHPNTQIDPDILRKQHHQKTADKVATRRIKERPMHQLSFYDDISGGKVEESEPLIRNYETLRAMQKKPTTYLRHKTHPKLLKLKQEGAALIHALRQHKNVKQNLLNGNKK
eukprot:UN06450